MENITLKALLDAKVQFGHQTNSWNPKMFPYIYKSEKGTHIIDVLKTKKLLAYSWDFVKEASRKKKTFLFVGTKPQARNIIKSEAERCGAFYIQNRWLGGSLTNWLTIRKRIQHLKKLEKNDKNGLSSSLPKKEKARILREKSNLKKTLGGLEKMLTLPDVVVIVDTHYENIALSECKKLNIPVIGVVDTNCNPTLVDIPIPANDDSASSIALILSKISDGILAGQ